ncbi:terminase small subunit [Salmonella enterica subsp. salamae]|nr:terminase small subunit [Salmonella enterica subsp. salamae serovar Sofia]
MVIITLVVTMPAEPKAPKRKSTQYKPLTAMQEAYAQEYTKCPENQTQAAINAGFSPNTAAVKASVMMRDERIQKRIAELMEERNKRLRVSADYVLLRLVEIDQMDVIDILNDDGTLKPIREWPKIWRTTLSGFDLSSTIMNMDETSIETILKKIKWPDKVKNLELIGKHVDVNAFKERLEVSGTVTIADRMAKARRRVKERAGGEE